MNRDAPACVEMRERLLEADPAELLGEGDSTVALHVAGCPACTAAARRILRSQQELADALSQLSARAAPAAGVVSVDLGASAESAVRPARGARRSLLRVMPPLAAAAVLVLFLLQPRAADELPRLEPVPEPTAYALDMPMVNATDGSDVAVMQTSNPNITVVWFLTQERQ
jgi:anti-sigma factor RsiW